jgi:PAS domain S-box-containing protein
MFGYDREELLGQTLEILLPERYRSRHVEHRHGYFAAPHVRAMGAGMSLAGRRKDGSEFPVEVGLSSVETPEGVVSLGLISDVTERKQAEDELSRVNEALRRSNSELGDFVYVASHDLQEPLRMIASYLQLLERRYKERLDAEGLEFIQYAVDGATRMKALLQDLLRYSRAGVHALDLRPVPASVLLDNALANLKQSIEDAQASIDVEPLPEIMADRGLFTQVFQNLVGNAIKFHVPGAFPHVTISSECRGSNCVFAIRDNGIGIEAEHTERIFRVFERLHGTEEYAGSGVGLAITKKIVERHGGALWVESEPGQGSTFYFSIPMAPANSTQLSKMANTSTQP